ncbi:MAG: L-threonylcarbamoyladenylate synthase [Nanoarchaeota archaeon]|nr:L-threonylcarbamoyladenylate synthase [Nanoarchaeota archaeon]
MAEIIKIGDINPKYIIERIKEGDVFIYPTDTIYGLGCNALDSKAVNRIRDIKKRNDKPFSVIAPSKRWILDNFKIKKAYVDKLPGPFTYVMKAKKKNLVCKEVAKGTIGVRIPDHPITKLIQKSKMPFVTTSVNLAQKKPYLKIKKISNKIKKKVDIIIDNGDLDNSPSTVFDFTEEFPRIIR